jgi:hypothetical protein
MQILMRILHMLENPKKILLLVFKVSNDVS